MKSNNLRIVVYVIISVITGLLAGYLLFNESDGSSDGHEHDTVEGVDDSTETIWTCSMHPQVRQNEPGVCPICEMDLIPLAGMTSNDPLTLEMTEESVKLAQVETFTVGMANTSADEITLSGKIYPDETRAASQVSHVAGRIERLYVRFTGEKVVEGQPIADIYSPQMISAQRELIEASRLSGSDSTLLNAARRKLELWKVPAELISDIEESGEIVETITLNADATGIVQKRKIAVGDYVQRGEVMFELVSLDELWVQFDAYEDDLPRISEGDRVQFVARAVPGKVFNTRVSFIDPLIDPATRTADIRAEINNTGGRLKPEMFVEGKIVTRGGGNEEIMIPRSAVLWTGKRSVVYVQVPEMDVPTFKYKEVTIGRAVGDHYIVLEGLSVGEEVVVNGAFSVDAAAQLSNKASMINGNVGIKGRKEEDILPDFKDGTPNEFRQQLGELTKEYLALKDALVESDAEVAGNASDEFVELLSEVDMMLLSDAAHDYWMTQRNALETHAAKISDSDEVEAQRKQFEFLSEAMVIGIRVFGITGDTLYVQHCPMAFDNDGADWISSEKEIRNPYFGEKMLKCGLITDTLGY